MNLELILSQLDIVDRQTLIEINNMLVELLKIDGGTTNVGTAIQDLIYEINTRLEKMT